MTTLDQAVLTLPFRGTWRAEMSPARRVPSHGTHLFATTYGIDFVAVQGRRSATTRDDLRIHTSLAATVFIR